MKAKKIDERDTMFSRAGLVKGSKEYAYYYSEHPERKEGDDAIRSKPELGGLGSAMYDPVHSKLADANFKFLSHIRTYAEGQVNPAKTQVDTQEITNLLRNLTLHYGAVKVGMTKVDPIHVYSHRGRHMENYGEKVDLIHEYALVFAVEMDKEIMNRAPKVPISMETSKAYVDGAIVGMQLSYFIRELGYEARNHMDGNYLVQCLPLAQSAGLGQAGRNGMLTTLEYGSRIRLGVVTTNLPLALDAPIDFGMEDLCKACKKCVRTCPGKAINPSDNTEDWYCNQEKCYDRWRSLGTDCGICLAVCPLSQDSPYELFGNDFTSYDKHTIKESLEHYNKNYGIRPFDKRPWPVEEL